MAAMMIASYTPDDPNFMVVHGRAGCKTGWADWGRRLRHRLFMIVGWGAWGIAIVLLVWGARIALHLGQERAMGRLIFAPIAIVLGRFMRRHADAGAGMAGYSAHNFGLGGLFGDTVLGAVLTYPADWFNLHDEADVGC